MFSSLLDKWHRINFAAWSHSRKNSLEGAEQVCGYGPKCSSA